jgi:hypothetical protein
MQQISNYSHKLTRILILAPEGRGSRSMTVLRTTLVDDVMATQEQGGNGGHSGYLHDDTVSGP